MIGLNHLCLPNYTQRRVIYLKLPTYFIYFTNAYTILTENENKFQTLLLLLLILKLQIEDNISTARQIQKCLIHQQQQQIKEFICVYKSLLSSTRPINVESKQ